MDNKHYCIENLIPILQNFLLFRNCGRDQIRQILTGSNWRIRHFKAGELLLTADSSFHYLIVVVSGKISEYGPLTQDGKNHLKRYLNPGDEYGTALIVCDELTEPLYLKADIESDLLFLDNKVIAGWIETCKYPLFINGLFASLGEKYRFAVWKISVLSCYETCARIMSYLHHFSFRNPKRPIMINCAKLAEEICVNRTALYRALSKLEAEGRIIRAGNGFRLPE